MTAVAYGIDYAFAPHPSSSALKAATVQDQPIRFIVRYVGSTDYTSSRSSKWLSPPEAKSLHAEYALVVVFETSAQRAEGGHDAGVADAKKAVRELAYCGLPADLPVYFAVDYDTTVGPHITGYFEGVASVLGLHRTGCYGGYKVIKALFDAGLIAYGWQTYAWSGGKWDGRAQLRQFSNGHNLGGADVDYDLATSSSYGQWPAASAPKPPALPPVPSGNPVLQRGSAHHTLVKQLQHAMNYAELPHLAEDGDYGAKTMATVVVLQRKARITTDGIYGPKSAKALKALVEGVK